MRPKPTSTMDETHPSQLEEMTTKKLSSPKPTKTDHDIQLSYSSTLELCNESCTFDGKKNYSNEIPALPGIQGIPPTKGFIKKKA